jgi:hypothetical protein
MIFYAIKSSATTFRAKNPADQKNRAYKEKILP